MTASANKLGRRPSGRRREPASLPGGDQTPRQPVGLYAQLSPEQRNRIHSVDVPIGSGRSDLPRFDRKRDTGSR